MNESLQPCVEKGKGGGVGGSERAPFALLFSPIANNAKMMVHFHSESFPDAMKNKTHHGNQEFNLKKY